MRLPDVRAGGQDSGSRIDRAAWMSGDVASIWVTKCRGRGGSGQPRSLRMLKAGSSHAEIGDYERAPINLSAHGSTVKGDRHHVDTFFNQRSESEVEQGGIDDPREDRDRSALERVRLDRGFFRAGAAGVQHKESVDAAYIYDVEAGCVERSERKTCVQFALPHPLHQMRRPGDLQSDAGILVFRTQIAQQVVHDRDPVRIGRRPRRGGFFATMKKAGGRDR